MPPDTAAPPRDLVAFRTAAQRYLARKGRRDEDLLSEMVLYVAARPDTVVTMAVVYLRALDVLTPRHRQHGGRQRETASVVSLDAPMPGTDAQSWHEVLGHTPVLPDPWVLARLRRRVAQLPPPEAAVWQAYTRGQTLRAIGATLGFTEAWASQLLARARARLTAAEEA